MQIIPFYSDADIDIFNRILDVMRNLAYEGQFSGNYMRLASSVFAFLICENNQDVGFMYFVDENIDNTLFVDMGFVKDSRGKGVSNKAVKIIMDEITKRYDYYILSEVSPSNIAAVKFTEKEGAIKLNDIHYLLQPERYDEFMNHLKELNINLENHNSGKRSIF